jgi:hypothetical protein
MQLRVWSTNITHQARFRASQRRTISISAMKAGMSRNTARKYLRQNEVMEQRQVPHTRMTRPHPPSGLRPPDSRENREIQPQVITSGIIPGSLAKRIFSHSVTDYFQV